MNQLSSKRVQLTLLSFSIKRGSSRFDSGFYWEYNHAGGKNGSKLPSQFRSRQTID
jgi:hypothetical protein